MYVGTTHPLTLVGKTASADYVLESLEPSTTYQWRIDTVVEGDTVMGEQWRFTTKDESE